MYTAGTPSTVCVCPWRWSSLGSSGMFAMCTRRSAVYHESLLRPAVGLQLYVCLNLWFSLLTWKTSASGWNHTKQHVLNDDARIVHDALLRCIMCLYQVVLIRMPQWLLAGKLQGGLDGIYVVSWKKPGGKSDGRPYVNTLKEGFSKLCGIYHLCDYSWQCL